MRPLRRARIRSASGSARPAAVTLGRPIRWCTSSAPRVGRHRSYRELGWHRRCLQSPTTRAAAIRGERPCSVPRSSGAERIVEVLGRRDLPARAVPIKSAMTALPVDFFLMLSAVLIAGTTAGIDAAPSLRWITPAFAGLLLVSARRPPRRRWSRPERTPTGCRTMSLVPCSPRSPSCLRARRATSWLISPGWGTVSTTGFSAPATRGTPPPCLASCSVASASAASDLALLDANLGRFERQRERLAARPSGSMDALARCERARDALVQRLLEAMTVLGQLQGQTADLDAAESELSSSSPSSAPRRRRGRPPRRRWNGC